MTTDKKMLPSRGVCQRYGVKSVRTIDRWREKGIIPPPDMVINNRNYWLETTLDANDRRLIAEKFAEREAASAELFKDSA